MQLFVPLLSSARKRSVTINEEVSFRNNTRGRKSDFRTKVRDDRAKWGTNVTSPVNQWQPNKDLEMALLPETTLAAKTIDLSKDISRTQPHKPRLTRRIIPTLNNKFVKKGHCSKCQARLQTMQYEQNQICSNCADSQLYKSTYQP